MTPGQATLGRATPGQPPGQATRLEDLEPRLVSPLVAAERRRAERNFRLKSGLVVGSAGMALAVAVLGSALERRRRRLLELQAEFVATVSHELKTPLASLRLMAETLERRLARGGAADGYPARMIRVLDGMAFLVENILSFNRLERGTVAVRRAEVDLGDVAAALAEELAMHTEKPVHVKVVRPDAEPHAEPIAAPVPAPDAERAPGSARIADAEWAPSAPPAPDAERKPGAAPATDADPAQSAARAADAERAQSAAPAAGANQTARVATHRARHVGTHRDVDVDARRAGAARIPADPELLRLVVDNLGRNACLYDDGDEIRIELSAQRGDGVVRLRFRDHGPGISEHDRGRVFEPFFRGRTGGDRRSGTGLGLAICRRVMELHGGTIELIETGRHGTTFELSFPERP